MSKRSVLYEMNSWLPTFYGFVWWKICECRNDGDKIKFTLLLSPEGGTKGGQEEKMEACDD